MKLEWTPCEHIKQCFHTMTPSGEVKVMRDVYFGEVSWLAIYDDDGLRVRSFTCKADAQAWAESHD